MVTYAPTSYTSLQDSITSICKNILPFSFKKRRIPAISAAEQHLSKQQSDNLKWQQDSFHQILNLMGRCTEGIISENEVSVFRTHLLETLIASPIDHEPPSVLRDKLVFLQELLYAKCISEEDYHASKRPLLQRLSVQGAEIDARDVIVGAQKPETSNEEWSVIDLKDDNKNHAYNQHVSTSKNSKRSIQSSTVRKMKEGVSRFGFISQDSNNQNLWEENVNDAAFLKGNLIEKEVKSKSSILMESTPSLETVVDKRKKRVKMSKKSWVFDGFKKWKKNDFEDALWAVDENRPTDAGSYGGKLVENVVGEGPDTKQIKRKLHPDGASTDFFVDKVLGEKIRKELSRIRTELGAKNVNPHISDDEIEVISTRLPVDKADLKMFFPKPWCDKYGDIVLDVVRKEFKGHMSEMGKLRVKKAGVGLSHYNKHDDENSNPNLPSSLSSWGNHHMPVNLSSSIDKGFKYNPFFNV